MVFLYGDLTEAQCQKDALDLLRRVVEVSVAVLKIHKQIEDSQAAMLAENKRLHEANEDIEQFQQAVQETIQGRVSRRSQDDLLSNMGQILLQQLDQQAQAGRARMSAGVEQIVMATQARIGQMAEMSLRALAEFFMESGLPVRESMMRCVLEQSIYKAHADVLDATGIRCTYLLDAAATNFFAEPKRFADLMAGKVEMPMGTKQAWLRKEPVLETIRIDDALLTGVSDSMEAGEYRLATRTGDGVEGMIARISKDENKVNVLRVDAEGKAHAVPDELVSQEHKAILLQFWRHLSERIEELYQFRSDLSSIAIDGKDAIDDLMAPEIVKRLIAYLSPIIREIDAHTPVTGELSLKVEHEDEGKREVFFLRKEKLIEKLQGLPKAHREFFVPLDIFKRSKKSAAPRKSDENTEETVPE